MSQFVVIVNSDGDTEERYFGPFRSADRAFAFAKELTKPSNRDSPAWAWVMAMESVSADTDEIQEWMAR